MHFDCWILLLHRWLRKILTPKLRGNDAKHYCPLERPVRPGREGRVLHFNCETAIVREVKGGRACDNKAIEDVRCMLRLPFFYFILPQFQSVVPVAIGSSAFASKRQEDEANEQDDKRTDCAPKHAGSAGRALERKSQ
jgi:hypothetical protein